MDSPDHSNSVDQQARDIFLSVIDSPEEDWPRLADQACQGDETLRDAVERLLGSQRRLGTFREATHTSFLPTVEKTTAQVVQLERVGPYRIIERLGQGGMGTVYMAEQKQPVRRRVALKVIKRGMDSEQVVARFEAERQALALMNHPNIAGVLDAGMTDDGRPFFVMDLVRGLPITDYCDKQKLNRDERLQLMQDVCQAVQHAHQKGIIHRDLKPTNVLVELHDVAHVPKVIDFGVAKATSQQLTERTLVTQFSQMIGTPLYMSPEQSELSGLDVDTRSDVYSLGVLLYELITGSTPFDRDTFRHASLEEMRRIIQEVEPLRPSQRISTLKAREASTIAERQGTDLRQLKLQANRELDWIVLKALDKDRSRRYESASALARDIQRYLDNEPLEAGPPSVGYRLGKYASRKKGLLVSVSLILLALIASTGISVWYAIRAKEAVQETEEAIQETNLANAQLLEESKAKGEAIVAYQNASELAEKRFQLALDAMDGFLIRVTDDDELQESQFVQLRENLLTSALPFLEQLMKNGNDRAALVAKAQALLRIGSIQHALGKYLEAIDSIEQVPSITEELADYGESDEWRRIQRDYHFGLGETQTAIGQHRQALENLNAAERFGSVMIAGTPSPRDREIMAKTLTRLAVLLDRLDRFEEADEKSEQSRIFWRDLTREFLPVRRFKSGLIDCRRTIAMSLNRQRRFEESCQNYQINIDQLEDLLRLSSVSRRNRLALANAHNGIAAPLRGLGKREEAQKHIDEAMALSQRLMDEYPDILGVVIGWAEIRNSLAGQYNPSAKQRSRDLLTSTIETLRTYERRFRNSPSFMNCLAKNYIDLGKTYAQLDKPVLAILEYRRGQAILEQLTEQNPEIPRYQARLAECLYDQAWIHFDQNRFTNAIFYQEMAIELQTELSAQLQDEPNYAEMLARMHSDLGQFLTRTLKEDEAQAHFQASYEIFQRLVDRFGDYESSRYFFAIINQNRGYHDKAVEMCDALIRDFPENSLKYKRILANAHFSLGQAKRDSFEEAMPHLTAAANAYCEYFAEATGPPHVDKLRYADCHQLIAILLAREGIRGGRKELEMCQSLFLQCIEDHGVTHPAVIAFARAEVSQCIEVLVFPTRDFALNSWRTLFEEQAGDDDAYQEIFQLIDEGLAR